MTTRGRRADEQPYETTQPGTIYWTLSLYIDADKVAGALNGAAGKRVGPDVFSLVQRRHLPSLALRNAIDPLMNDIADRETQGRAVEVCCLNVGEPVTQWEVLRFRTQAEIARFQAERAQAFIEEACAPLSAGHIPCRGFFKWGGVVFSILDTAEELACDAIVMPPPVGGLLGLFSKEIVVAVIRKSRNIPVITVGRQGMPVPPADGGDITH